MKPILLKIQGLNSFEEEQIIDFQKLTANGIFGVFGPTGSGKSTIVDAMTLALYGEISRYDGEKGGRQFINTHCNTMAVSFTFALSDGGKDVHYTAERVYKKKDDTIRMSLARLYKKDGPNEMQVLADKTSKVTSEVARLIGLSYDDFSRSVILPQGKFSQFLLLANKDRRDMLERLFKLEKYGEKLSRRIRNEASRTKTRLEVVENTLEVYADATSDNLSKVEAALRTEEETLTALRLAATEKTAAYEDAKDIQSLFNEYNTYNNLRQDCEVRQPEITAIKEALAAARKAGLVRPHIISAEDGERKLAQIRANRIEHAHKEKQAEERYTEAKKAYENSEEERKARYPLLMQKESDLKRALRLSDDKHAQTEEHRILRRDYQVKKEQALRLSAQWKQKETEQNALRDELDQIAIRKSQINIQSDFREKIAKGREIQKKLTDTEKAWNAAKNKADVLTAAVKAAKEKHFVLDKRLLHTQTQIQQLTARQEEASKECPGDSAYLAAQKAALIDFENRLTLEKEKAEKWKALQAERTDLLIFLEETGKALEQHGQTIAHIQQQRKENEEKLAGAQNDRLIYEAAKKLTENEPCPVCGSIHHPQPAKLVTEGMLNALLDLKRVLEQTLAEETALMQNAQIREAAAKQTAERLLADIETAVSGLNDFDPDQETQEFHKMEAEYKHLQSLIESYESQKQETERALLSLTQAYHADNLQKAELAGGLSIDEKNLNSMLSELQNFESEIKALRSSLTAAASEAGTSDFMAWEKKIKAFDVEKSKLEKQEEANRKHESQRMKEAEEIQKKIIQTEKKMETLTVIGLQKKEALEKLSEEIAALTDGQEPAAALESLQMDIHALNTAWESSKQNMEKSAAENQLLLETGAGLRKQEETMLEISNNLQIALEKSLTENGFAAKEDAWQHDLPLAEQIAMEEHITAHEDRLKTVLDHLSRLLTKLQNRDTRDIDLRVEQLQAELSEIHKNIEHKAENTAIMRERIKKLSSDMQKAESLSAQKKELETANDLLTDMAGLFAGNRFVEYVAKRYLKYVSAEASVRLKEMTSGRYALEIDGTDFVVRDDYAGGARRSPKTLSGGETFMAALCLSLALSSRIQLKNNASLAFFFLDEGFGTLDPASLDVVMNALERLRMEDLKVGIISHVEELKSRVPSRLIVSPAEQGVCGTTLQIE